MWIAVFTGLYRFTGSTTLAGYDLPRMIWYQAGALFIGTITYNQTDWDIAHKILSGDLVQDLLRPVTLFRFELGEALGMRLFALVVEILPGLVILPCLYFPSFLTRGSLLRFIPVAAGAFVLFYLINFLIGLLAFTMKSTASLGPIRGVIVMTLGGFRIPLEFFPPWLVTLNAFLPFQYVFYYPIRVFINAPGTQTAVEFLRIVGAQAAWIAGLYLLYRLCWRGAFRKFCAVG
jgi:ABC-2 type transport system permease protein